MSQDMIVSLQHALLGFLMVGPRHGYELHQEFSRDLGRVWHLGRSKLYAQLRQLEETDWVSVETELQGNRPPRKIYRLTPAGRAAFDEWLQRPSSYLRRLRIEFLTRVYFFQHLSLAGLDQLVADQKLLLQDRIDSLAHSAAETDDPFWRLVLQFRQGQLEAVIRWLDECLETA